MQEKNHTTELLILEAARAEFQQKGLAGTRMQAIADRADINRALLHHYYRDKQTLFEAVLRHSIEQLLPKLTLIFEMEAPLFEKIDLVVKKYIRFIHKNPYLPIFIIHELHNHPEEFIKSLFESIRPNPVAFIKQIQEETVAGLIHPIDPKQLITNILSLSIFPFLGKPMFKNLLDMDEESFDAFLIERQESLSAFIINGIKRQH